MKQCILCICVSILFFTACSNPNSIEELSNEEEVLVIQGRMDDNCTVTPVDDDLLEDCDVFESIYMDGEDIHIKFDTSQLGTINKFDCLNNTIIYDRTQTVSAKLSCGLRDYHPLYCTTPDDAEIVVDLKGIETDTAIVELCFLSECLELNELLEDCFSDVGSSGGSGTFCMELTVICD